MTEAGAGRHDRKWDVAVVLASVVPLLGWWAYGLFDLDEGFYASVVGDMIRRGDWITPTLNGMPWFEKPILLYWLAIPSVQLFGPEIGPRLPSVVCTLLTAWAVFAFTRRHFDLWTARLATMAYGGSLLVVGVGRMMLTDGPLVLCLALAFFTFYDSLGVDPRRRLWSAEFLGLAVLAKGPVAVVFFVVTVGLFFALSPGMRSKYRGYWMAGTAVSLAVIAAWYVPAYLRDSQVFVQQFIIEHNLQRFGGGDVAHKVPFWAVPLYYPVVLFLALLPWTLAALRSRVFAREDARGDDGAAAVRRFLWCWAGTVAVFFTVSAGKLPHYILPAVAPLVILAVDAVRRRHPAGWPAERWAVVALVWAGIVTVLANGIFQWDWRTRMREVQSLAAYARAQGQPLALVEIGRQEPRKEISLQLQDTSHPSVYFYYGGLVRETNELARVADEGRPTLVLTRAGRISDEELAPLRARGWDLTPVDPFPPDRFRLYQAAPVSR